MIIQRLSLFFGNVPIEIITTIIAAVFLIIGIYLNKKSLQKPAKNPDEIDTKKIALNRLHKKEIWKLYEEECSNNDEIDKMIEKLEEESLSRSILELISIPERSYSINQLLLIHQTFQYFQRL